MIADDDDRDVRQMPGDREQPSDLEVDVDREGNVADLVEQALDAGLDDEDEGPHSL